MTVYVPQRVLFVAVEGNHKVSTARILREAENCGLHFGSIRADVRSEEIKNRLIQQIPELSWVGVNTAGCTAVIRVRESVEETEQKAPGTYSSIVAVSDAVVTSCTVLSGTAECVVGDAVKKGQVLISGYQDLGILVKLTRSKGEVFGRTDRQLCVIAPRIESVKATGDVYETSYSLFVGKKRINLSKCSGISYKECDKIYTEYSIVLPGGYILPISLSCERFWCGDTTSSGTSVAGDVIADSNKYLFDHTISAEIIDSHYSVEEFDDFSMLTIRYDCLEMIGRERNEEYQINYE